MGILNSYSCSRCPLVFEIGGYAFWEFAGRCERTVCRACGTMHRLTEQDGACEVAALPGPVRELVFVAKTAEWYVARYGEENLKLLVEVGMNPYPEPGTEHRGYEWPFEASDWELIGTHPGGIAALAHLACARCGAVGEMQSLSFPPDPDGGWNSFKRVCPLCFGPMEGFCTSTVH